MGGLGRLICGRWYLLIPFRNLLLFLFFDILCPLFDIAEVDGTEGMTILTFLSDFLASRTSEVTDLVAALIVEGDAEIQFRIVSAYDEFIYEDVKCQLIWNFVA